jgi:hypothetical protein
VSNEVTTVEEIVAAANRDMVARQTVDRARRMLALEREIAEHHSAFEKAKGNIRLRTEAFRKLAAARLTLRQLKEERAI